MDILGEPEEALAVYLGKVNSWREGDVIEVKSIDEGPAVFRVFRARPGNGDFVAAAASVSGIPDVVGAPWQDLGVAFGIHSV